MQGRQPARQRGAEERQRNRGKTSEREDRKTEKGVETRKNLAITREKEVMMVMMMARERESDLITLFTSLSLSLSSAVR